MKGLKFVWSPFKTFGVVEFRVMINAYPFNLILKFAGSFAALKNLLYLPFGRLVIDYR